jgi:hypothetical protein
MRSLRTIRSWLAVVAVATVVVAPPVQAQNQPSAQARPNEKNRVRQQTPDERGVAGRKVKDVVAEARSNRNLSAIFSEDFIELANDDSAYLDSSGQLFFADFDWNGEAPEPAAPAPERIIDAQPPANAFALHSRPGSSKTIYLDFDGDTTTNSGWTDSEGLTTKTVPPFDRDGVPGSFNDTERNYIINVWQSVSEDYAPFDVDITTQLPPSTALSIDFPGDVVYGVKATITPENWLCGVGCVGVAYGNVFGNNLSQTSRAYYSPAWAFPSANMTAGTLAQTISHEVGHNLSLKHDGTATADYYSGHNNWTPIMGSATSRAFTQWSRGEYAGASNLQDDLAVIEQKIPLVADTAGSTPATARVIPITATNIEQTTISSASDVDVYRVDGATLVQPTLRMAPFGPNLFATLKILDANGNPIATSPATSTSTSLTYSSISASTYYLVVESTASGTPSTGFSTYGSIGVYSLQLVLLDTPPSVSNISVAPTADGTITATWTAAPTTATVTYEATACIDATCGTPVTTSALTASFSSLPSDSTAYVKVVTRNTAGSPSAVATSPTVQVLYKPTAPLAQQIRYLESPTRSVTVNWSGQTQQLANPVESTSWTIKNRSTGQEVSGSFAGNTSGRSGTFSGLIPVTWANTWIDVTMTSTALQPAPFRESSPVTTSVYLGRLEATQSATVPTTPRSAAPQAPTVTTPRSSPPQA